VGINEPEKAKKHFEAILQFDSNNKAATNQMVFFKRKIYEQRETDKKLYSLSPGYWSARERSERDPSKHFQQS
jgi:hypothetical protein